MAQTTYPRRLLLPILVLLPLITSLEVAQGDSAENGACHMILIEGEKSTQSGHDPMAFLVLDVWLSPSSAVWVGFRGN